MNKLNLTEIKYYMRTLIDAVDHLAQRGVMHRDIKPTNFLYDPDTRSGLLIDFGLSEIEMDHSTGLPRNTKHRNDPEVLKIV